MRFVSLSKEIQNKRSNTSTRPFFSWVERSWPQGRTIICFTSGTCELYVIEWMKTLNALKVIIWIWIRSLRFRKVAELVRTSFRWSWCRSLPIGRSYSNKWTDSKVFLTNMSAAAEIKEYWQSITLITLTELKFMSAKTSIQNGMTRPFQTCTTSCQRYRFSKDSNSPDYLKWWRKWNWKW